MIEQVTVFLENEKGRLSALSRSIGDMGVSMLMLMVADTDAYGVARIVCDRPQTVSKMLVEKGYRASVVEVEAVDVADRPGGLADLLEAVDAAQLNIEYAYCFSNAKNKAIAIMRLDKLGEEMDAAFRQAGFKVLVPEDLYVLDD